MKLILLLLFLASSVPVFSQKVEENDSTVTLTLEEARILTKMTEDLKWTKKELAVSDSIINHQDKVISLKDQMIELKNDQIEKISKDSKKKLVKTSLISGAAGIALGIILGLFL